MKSTEVDQGLFTDSYCKVCSAQLISESQRVAHYEVKTPPPPPHITPRTHTTLTHHTLMKLMKGSGVAPFFRLYLGRRSARPIHLSPAAYTLSINTQHPPEFTHLFSHFTSEQNDNGTSSNDSDGILMCVIITTLLVLGVVYMYHF